MKTQNHSTIDETGLNDFFDRHEVLKTEPIQERAKAGLKAKKDRKAVMDTENTDTSKSFLKKIVSIGPEVRLAPCFPMFVVFSLPLDVFVAPQPWYIRIPITIVWFILFCLVFLVFPLYFTNKKIMRYGTCIGLGLGFLLGLIATYLNTTPWHYFMVH